MIFISQHTGGNYGPFADRLEKSLKSLELPYHIEQFDGTGDWLKNTNGKPRFILSMLEKFREPVVWLDADCTVCQKPDLLLALPEKGIDIASYNWYADENALTQSENPVHKLDTRLPALSSGVIYFNYTQTVLDFVQVWRDLCECRGDIVDDHLLNGLIYIGDRFNQRWPMRYEWLPKSYNRMKSHWPDVEPVIDHECVRGKIFDGTPKQIT